MAQEIVLVVLAVFFIWILILSFFLWKTLAHYNRLTRYTSAKDLKVILEQLIQGVEDVNKKTNDLSKHTERLIKDGLLHAQKVGLLRFNPFRDTGGDQSFILAILDGKDNGIIISSLHSRAGTRWYAKKVLGGKGVEHELSSEEKEAIKLASKNG